MPEADRHFELVDEKRSIERVRQTLDILERSQVQYVVEGGWAVAAYESPVPSVDLDILVKGGLAGDVAERVETTTSIQLHATAGQEALGIDMSDSQSLNRLLGTGGVGYVPERFLDGHVVRMPVQMLDGQRIPVPEPTQLAVMKLKAFRDRRLQWEAVRQRYLLDSIDDDVREITVRSGEPYWLRKAGKDLFDLGHLLNGHTMMASMQRAAPPEVWPYLPASLDKVPLPLQQFATSMAKRAGVKWRPPWTE